MPIGRTGAVAVLIAVLASAALLLAGCGSKKSTTTTTSATVTWADGVCTAVTTYKTSLTDTSGALMRDISAAGIEQAATDVKTATDTLVSDLKGLGKPETASGQQAKQIVDTLSTQLTADTKTIQDSTGTSALAAAATDHRHVLHSTDPDHGAYTSSRRSMPRAS